MRLVSLLPSFHRRDGNNRAAACVDEERNAHPAQLVDLPCLDGIAGQSVQVFGGEEEGCGHGKSVPLKYSGSSNKRDNCCRTLERHDSVANALEACGSAITHVEGQPINHAAKSGFKCRREFWMLSDDSSPSLIALAWGE